jgi:predicted alpha/beta superfamily hydrolase
MVKSLLGVFLFLFTTTLPAQTLYEEISSPKLGEKRKLKIQLPRSYHQSDKQTFPVILVLDGDYLFEPVAGNVDYYSYWEEMPEAIVVGIMQGNSRDSDCAYDLTNNFPVESGANFFEFIGLELMPWLDKKFRTAPFVMAVGHELTANFINYYLFKDPPLFNGYIVLSPDFAPGLENLIGPRLEALPQRIFYYAATGSDDIKSIREVTQNLNTQLSSVNKDNITYYFDDFEGASHYSVVGKAIPSALEQIFSVFRPITRKEFDEVLLKLDTPIFDYLDNKYKTIEGLFGFKTIIRENDIIAIASASERKNDLESLEKVAKLAQREYPDTVLGYYYLGKYYELSGDKRRAMRTYQAAHDLEEVGFITIDLLLDSADRLRD